MLRTWFIFILVIGIAGSLAGRLSLPSPSSEETFKRVAAEQRRANDEAEMVSRPNPADGSIVLDRSSDGHFYADVKINGSTVHMLVDTGASAIALTRADARAAGVATSIGMNDVVGEGADGAVHGDFIRLDRVELGHRSEGLDAVVLNGGAQSLLGQSFLRGFASVEIEGDRMVLR